MISNFATNPGQKRTRTQSNERSENTNDGGIKDSISDDLFTKLSSRIEFPMATMALTIPRRSFFCLIENRGARICFEGHSQTKSGESAKGMIC